MAWSFPDWATWTDTLNRRWAVVVAAGAIVGAGTLYWYDRAEPNYPAAQDEAVLIAADLERRMAVGRTNDLNYIAYTNIVDGVTNALVATNAVGYYPSWHLANACATSIVTTLSSTPTFSYRATPGGSWATGRDFWVASIRPDAWDSSRIDAFADASGSWGAFFAASNQMAQAWWSNNICASPIAYQYPWQTNILSYHPAYSVTNLVWMRPNLGSAPPVYVLPCTRDVSLGTPHPHLYYVLGGTQRVYCVSHLETNAIDEVFNWHAPVPYIRTAVYHDIAKAASAMRDYAQRGTVSAYTNYARTGYASAGTFDAALAAAWAGIAASSVVTSSYWGPFEGAVSSVTAGGSYSVYLNLITTDLVLTNLTPCVLRNDMQAITRVVFAASAPVWIGLTSTYATNGIGVASGAPRLHGSTVWTNRLQWARLASDWRAFTNISIPSSAGSRVTGWQIAREPNGIGGYHWQEIMLITTHPFLYLTNSATIWGDE